MSNELEKRLAALEFEQECQENRVNTLSLVLPVEETVNPVEKAKK